MSPIPNSNGNVQRALKRGPGSASAAVLWTIKQDKAKEAIRAAAALLKFAKELKQPGNLEILVGLSHALLAESASSQSGQSLPEGNWAAGESVFVQVAAQTHVDRLYALRLIDATLGAVCDRQWEILGDRILHSMEGLGFRDGEPPVWDKDFDDLPGMWLVQQRFDYQLGEFFARGPQNDRGQRDRARSEVIGRTPGVVLADIDKAPGQATERGKIEGDVAAVRPDEQGRSSHWAAMKSLKGVTLMRRGFPFRHGGSEGLMFLAASPRTADFKTALDLFFSKDKLAQYVRGQAPALFFCPNNAEDLLEQGEEVAALPIPPAAEVLQHGPDLMDYTVSVDDMNYMETFVFEFDALQPMPLREQVAPGIRALFTQMHEVLAAGDANKVQRLESLLDKFHETSRQINRVVGTYITKG